MDTGHGPDAEPLGPPPPPLTRFRKPPGRVLARGHLHPAILLLRLLDSVRQVVFPALIALLLQQVWFVVFAGVVFVLNLGYALARYLTLQYTLTTEELILREGILHRQERRIPLDRVQDIGFESTLLRRALGLAVVLVETASGKGVEARLDALGRDDADRLREVLLAARRDAARASAPTSPPGTPPPAEREWVVHRSTAGELFVRGLTDLRMSAFFVTGYAAYETARELGAFSEVTGVADHIRSWLLGFSPLALVLLLFSALLIVIGFGLVTATLGNLVQFHGFLLTLRGSTLLRRYGLLTTRQKTLPRERIQRISIEQNWLRRLLGYGVVKADSAGGSRAQGEDTTGGWDVVVPLMRVSDAYAILPAMLPGIERCRLQWGNASRRLIARTTMQGALLAALLTPALTLAFGPWGLFGLLPIPIWAALGVLVWRSLAYGVHDEFLALQHGVIGRYTAWLPTRKVQSVILRQSPVEQFLGLAELTIHVAGGSPTRLPDLTIGDARELRDRLAALAARAAAEDFA